MSVKIRLTRTGATNSPSYRLVAADAKSPRDGRFIEILGWYNPRKKGGDYKLKLDRIEYWVGQGAQLSETARNLVKKAGKAQVAENAEPVPQA